MPLSLEKDHSWSFLNILANLKHYNINFFKFFKLLRNLGLIPKLTLQSLLDLKSI